MGESQQFLQEPVAPPPRKVPYRSLDWNTRFLIPWGGSFFLGGIVFIVVSFIVDRPIWDDWILDNRAERALAQPTAVNDTGSAVNGLSVDEIELSFIDGSGRARAASAFVSDKEVLIQAQRMVPLTIEYDPRQPTRCRIEGQPASVMGALILLPLLSLLMGLAALIPAAISTYRIHRLYRWGTATQAKVTRVSATGSSEGDEDEDQVMRAHYVFNSQAGRTEGSLKRISPPQPGTKIWIIYDPREPSRNVAVPEKGI